VLYVFHKSLTETIPRLHGLNQVHALASRRPFIVVSFERGARGRAEGEAALYSEVRSWLADAGVSHVGLPTLGSRWLEIPLGAVVILGLTVFRGVRIIHARSYIPALMGLPSATLTGARLLFDMRGLFVEEYLHDGAFREGTFRLSLARRLERLLLSGSDAIVAVSEAFRAHLLERPDLRGRVEPERLHVIPNRADVSRFEAAVTSRDALRRQRGWEGSIVAVFTGSTAGWHRLDRTMEIMSGVISQLPEARFVAAVYPGTSEALQIASRFRIPPDRIEITTVPVEGVPPLLAAADLGLMFIESHVSKSVCAPIKFSEYMAAGLPTVASPNVGDTQSWIERERLGVVVDHDAPLEAVPRILEFVTSSDFASGAARERCLSFARSELDMRDTLEQYESIYEELECLSEHR
jgi:glycosyltransferase involved in cell wall biosynthesis